MFSEFRYFPDYIMAEDEKLNSLSQPGSLLLFALDWFWLSNFMFHSLLTQHPQTQSQSYSPDFVGSVH